MLKYFKRFLRFSFSTFSDELNSIILIDFHVFKINLCTTFLFVVVSVTVYLFLYFKMCFAALFMFRMK